MELVCNELSFLPLAENSHQLENRFKNMILAFREAKKVFDFTHIRFPVTFSTQQVTSKETLIEWISTHNNPTLKNLILGLFKNPFTDDLEDTEANIFFQSEYSITSPNAPTTESPIGMPVAYIKSVPSISFDSHAFWRNRKIELTKTSNSQNGSTTFQVHNICQEADLISKELNEWAENCMPHFIESEELLFKFLGFKKFASVFPQFHSTVF